MSGLPFHVPFLGVVVPRGCAVGLGEELSCSRLAQQQSRWTDNRQKTTDKTAILRKDAAETRSMRCCFISFVCFFSFFFFPSPMSGFSS